MNAVYRILAVVALTFTVALPARAETILLTSGAFNWISGGGPASVTMAGTTFSFIGTAAAPVGGVFSPWLQCSVPECTAGTTVDLFTRFVGADISGTATYNGVTYSPVGSVVANASLDTRWSGSLLIPSGFSGGTLSSPFQFAGEFFFQDSPTTGGVVDLLGGGQASLSFTPYPSQPGAFALTAVRYEFDAASTVPEPTSMILIGSGLAGLAALRGRRQRQDR